MFLIFYYILLTPLVFTRIIDLFFINNSYSINILGFSDISIFDFILNKICISDMQILFGFFIILLFYLFISTNSYNNLSNCYIYLYLSLLLIFFIIFSLYEEFYVIHFTKELFYTCNINYILFTLNKKFIFYKFIVTIFMLLLLLYIQVLSYENIKEKFFFDLGITFSILWLICCSIFLIIVSNDLINIILLLELQTFSSLILYFLLTNKKYSINETLKLEASIKYFLMSGLGSCFLFLGISILYFSLGTIDIIILNELLIYPLYDSIYYYIIFLSLLLLFIGFSIKLGVTPFHQWTIDIVVGLPYPILCYFFTLPKITFFIIIFKLHNIFFINFSFFNSELFIAILLLLNIIIISINTIYDLRIKRIIVFSNISSTSTILLMYLTYSSYALNIYIYMYMFLTMFMYISLIYILTILRKIVTTSNFLNKELINIDESLNINFIYPVIGYIYIFTIFSLIGLPPFIGFFIKFIVIFNFSIVTDNYIYIGGIFFLFTLYISFYYLLFVRSLFTVKDQYYFTLYSNITRFSLYICLCFFYINLYISFVYISTII